MGSNGQQLTIYLPAGTGKVRVAGTNQNNQQVIWDGVATQNWQGPYFVAATVDRWWKGPVQIWYNDSQGTTHYGRAPTLQLCRRLSLA